MQQTILKAQFKIRSKAIPCKEISKQEEVLKSLRGSLVYYEDPDKPAIDPDDWEVLK